MCGENFTPAKKSLYIAGSSPRVRGKPGRPTAISFMRGLIPACAGKTYGYRKAGRQRRAHPRVCGENPGVVYKSPGGVGSSPRVRGKLDFFKCARQFLGLIPACAGKTNPLAHNPDSLRAHPRVCGENPEAYDAEAANAGSSPRVRGKPSNTPEPWVRRRLIPACAGKTRTQLSGHEAKRAHPRVCGENTREARKLVRSSGSSPRVRGKLSRALMTRSSIGLIPACAGKTSQPRARSWHRSAHPRVCGENLSRGVKNVAGKGSSPRVRGKRNGRVH